MRKSDEKEGVGLIAGSGGSATPLRLPGERGGIGSAAVEDEKERRVCERASERASPTKEKRKSKRESGRLAQLRRRRKEK